MSYAIFSLGKLLLITLLAVYDFWSIGSIRGINVFAALHALAFVKTRRIDERVAAGGAAIDTLTRHRQSHAAQKLELFFYDPIRALALCALNDFV